MNWQFICYPRCSTCKKAKEWLNENGIQYSERDISKENPSQEELRNYLKKSGLDIKKFFNTSGKKYRELNLKEKIKESSEEELLAVLATDGMLVKRPILVNGSQVLVGFKEEQWSKIK